MVDASGVRVAWADLPGHVRDVVADLLGSPVVAAVSQPGGFSPGSADRVRTADGRRAFVKAVAGAVNPHSPVLHRREIACRRRAARRSPRAPAPGQPRRRRLGRPRADRRRGPPPPAAVGTGRARGRPAGPGAAGRGAAHRGARSGWAGRVPASPRTSRAGTGSGRIRHRRSSRGPRATWTASPRPPTAGRPCWRGTGSSTATSAPTTCSSGPTARWSSSTGRGPRGGPGGSTGWRCW